MNFIDILKYGFLIIFFATAIIGIAGIPGWIKIPEWYRKRIFIALVLEVVGAIIILFRQEFIINDSAGIPGLKINNENWTALDDSALIVKPEITIATQDTTFTISLGNQSHSAFNGLTAKIIRNGLSIRNADSITLGHIPGTDIERVGLFNSIKTAKNEITSTENYAYIKWEKNKNGKWMRKGSFLDPFELEVYDDHSGTYYRIKNKTDNKHIFDSKSNAKDLIYEDNRIIHFLKYQKVYYLLRITWADLQKQQNEKYVHVINVKIQPTFKGE